jgi:hypothetical protein
LPQVLSIVERHTGTIDVHSDPHQGTSFVITLPASVDAVAPESSRVAERQAGPPVRTIRILIVEDEDQLARMASQVKRRWPFLQKSRHSTWSFRTWASDRARMVGTSPTPCTAPGRLAASCW